MTNSVILVVYLLNKMVTFFRNVFSFSLAIFAYDSYGQTIFESVGGGLSHDVRDFVISPDSNGLITVGRFGWTREDNLRANGIAQWDGNTWEVGSFGNGTGDTSTVGYENIPVLSVASYRDTLFVSFLGSPWHYDDDIHVAAFLADGVWYACGNANSLSNIMLINDRLYTGNQLDTVNNFVQWGIHEWIGGQWRELPNSPFDALAGIYGATHWQDQYYFAGIFQALGSRKIIAFDGDSTWSPLENGIVGSHLNVVEGHGDSLYVGGFFPEPSTHIAIWNGIEWLPFFPEVQFIGQVYGLKSYDGSLYVKGVYHFVGDTTLYGLLRWDGSSLCALGGPLGADCGPGIDVFQGELYMSMAPTYDPLYYQFIAKLPLENIVPFACVVPSLVSTHQNEAISGELSIFPNPATGSVNICFPGGVVGHRIELTNALGQLVVSETVAGFTTQISLAGVAPGVYQVTAFSKAGSYFGRVLVE